MAAKKPAGKTRMTTIPSKGGSGARNYSRTLEPVKPKPSKSGYSQQLTPMTRKSTKKK